ncbi:MAG TPA: capsule assembly Wzi family protein [Gemmatimonadaceae bacterium]|jgi:hypothetical protein
MKRFFFALLVLSSAIAASTATAQARPMVPPGERVYRDIDRLAAAGLIDTLVLGARPFSEREVVRLLSEAQRNLSRNPNAQAWAAPTIAGDLARWTRGKIKPMDAAFVELSEMDNPYRPAPVDPNGKIDAVINPLAANRSARVIANGFTADFETFHSVTLGSHVALSINPKLVTVTPRAGGMPASTLLRLQTGSANFLFGNLSIDAGRDYTIFGQAPSGGLLLSDNAPPLNMVRVSNDIPFELPWWLHAFGPMRATAFVADLGPTHQVHPHSKLIGYHIAALPVRQLEVGLEVIDAMGGKGGQPATFGDRVLDVVPIFDVFRSGSDFQFSNKMAGGDFHWRVPSWRGFELYGETGLDDFDARRLRIVFLQDGGYIAGTSLSCILECGRLGVRAEYRQTGIRYYTHYDYFLAEHQELLGDPLGPRGLGGYLTVDGESHAGIYGALTGAFEVRSGNTYSSHVTNSSGANFHFVLAARRPGEKRERVMATLSTDRGTQRVSVRATAGVEHVTNFRFVAGSDRNNVLGTVGLMVRP